MKWVRSGPAQARTEPWRLRTELATLQFLSDDLERLAAFARARGELSAATAGRARTYRDRCTALGFPAPAGDAKRRLAGLWDRGDEDAAALGAPIAGPVASELTAVIEELNAPGPFLALSHGDAQSNNILVRESGPADARLIDFEDAGYAHALTDAVCLHAPGPGWVSVRFVVLDTRAPGDLSRLQLVETLESAARAAEAYRALPHLAGWARLPPYSPRR